MTQQIMNRRRFLGTAIGVTGLLASCGTGAGEGGGLNEKPLPTSARPPTLTPISPEELAKVSSESGEYEMIVVSMKDPAQPKSGYAVPDGSRLVAIEVTFENLTSPDTMDISPQFALVTAEGDVTYDAVSEAVDKEIAVGQINKGEKANGWLAFVVPNDAKLKDLTYRIGLISTVTLVAKLTK